MAQKSEIIDRLHNQALAAVRNFKRCEIDLLVALQACDQHRVHTALGHPSLFVYATHDLGLSDDVAYIFIKVARKSTEVPALKTAIASGKITVSKAKRIASVMTRENQKYWLEAAEKCSKFELEKLVASEMPEAAVLDKFVYVSGDRVSVQIGLSESLMLKLRRAQEILSQKKRRHVGLEETLSFVVEECLRRLDPVQRAKRRIAKGAVRIPLDEIAVSNPQLGPGPVKSDTVLRSSGGQNDLHDELLEILRSEGRSTIAVGAKQQEQTRKVEENPKAKTNAKRRQKSTDNSNLTARKALSAAVKHAVYFKYNGQCAYVDQNGSRCERRRFLDIHHIRPLYEGGEDRIENLELLCFSHHQQKHNAH